MSGDGFRRAFASPLRRLLLLRLVLLRLLPLLLGSFVMTAEAADTARYGLGRAPTQKEIDAWDIDVRPDFVGLPKGSGTVARGQDLWDNKCASCHGVFGESNEVFNPIIGGTTADDAKAGVVKSLTTSELQRTTMMKLSSLATLWDYIRRAMPWNAPKSLSPDDVYALTAYILNLADLVPSGFVLSDANIRETEKLLPNRNGMTRSHGMWDIRGKPDVRNSGCMEDCAVDVTLRSSIPDYARNAHGNLADQNRTFGAVRGIDTTKPVGTPTMAADTAPTAAMHPGLALANRQGCMACHAIDRKLLGPSFQEVASRRAPNGAASELAERIKAGGSGQWGTIPMPAQSQLSGADARSLAEWIVAGAGTKERSK